MWEFAGGKCEADETPEQCVIRECLEETGLQGDEPVLHNVIVHEYPHATVELWCYEVGLAEVNAEPSPDSGFIWVNASTLRTLEFPEANRSLIAGLAGDASEADD